MVSYFGIIPPFTAMDVARTSTATLAVTLHPNVTLTNCVDYHAVNSPSLHSPGSLHVLRQEINDLFQQSPTGVLSLPHAFKFFVVAYTNTVECSMEMNDLSGCHLYNFHLHNVDNRYFINNTHSRNLKLTFNNLLTT